MTQKKNLPLHLIDQKKKNLHDGCLCNLAVCNYYMRSHFTEWTIRRNPAHLNAKLQDKLLRQSQKRGRPRHRLKRCNARFGFFKGTPIRCHGNPSRAGVEVALNIGLVAQRLDTGCRFCCKRNRSITFFFKDFKDSLWFFFFSLRVLLTPSPPSSPERSCVAPTERFSKKSISAFSGLRPAVQEVSGVLRKVKCSREGRNKGGWSLTATEGPALIAALRRCQGFDCAVTQGMCLHVCLCYCHRWGQRPPPLPTLPLPLSHYWLLVNAAWFYCHSL